VWQFSISNMDLVVVIVVGSTNPVKLESARNAFQQIFSGKTINVHGLNVPSGVSIQPLGDAETQQGATQRAKSAYDLYHQNHSVYPDFSVGLEGGIQRVHSDVADFDCFAWAAIFDGKRIGTARSASFLLPRQIGELLNSGLELGEADDAVFGTTNSKQKQGTIGQLTNGLISRTQYYEPIVILAYVPFFWPTLYPFS
jgi:inosine/xanthosine triphosphatase